MVAKRRDHQGATCRAVLADIAVELEVSKKTLTGTGTFEPGETVLFLQLRTYDRSGDPSEPRPPLDTIQEWQFSDSEIEITSFGDTLGSTVCGALVLNARADDLDIVLRGQFSGDVLELVPDVGAP